MNNKKGIAISLYNKFDELAILHDIFRNNFKDDYYLYVCSNCLDAKEEIEKRNLQFDGFVQGEDIYYSNKLTKEEQRLSLVCRSADTIKKSCTLAMEDGCDYVMHIHCDAWPLNEEKLQEHFLLLEDNQHYSIAVRGLGWSYYGIDRPLGGIDDHFFIFNVNHIKKNNIFDFDTLQMLPHMLSIHGILGAQIIVKLSIEKCLYFDTFENSICWENEKKLLPYLPVKPSAYDQERKFLHVHRESFPEKLGFKLQAYYLSKNNIFKGCNVKSFLEKHPFEKNLPVYLSHRLHQSIKKIKLYGYLDCEFAQEISSIENELKQVTFLKIIKNHIKKLLRYLLLRFRKNNKIWPNSLERYYRNRVNREYFKERDFFWFNKGETN